MARVGPQLKKIYIPGGGADKSLAGQGKEQARKHVRDACCFNIETRAVIKLFFLQGKAPKEIHAIVTETSACLLPGRVKDLSAPLYIYRVVRSRLTHFEFEYCAGATACRGWREGER